MTKKQREEKRAAEIKAQYEQITADAHRTAREQTACETCAAGKCCIRHG